MTSDIAAALHTLRTAGWTVAEDTGHGHLVDAGPLGPLLTPTYGGGGHTHRRWRVLEPWTDRDATCPTPGDDACTDATPCPTCPRAAPNDQTPNGGTLRP